MSTSARPVCPVCSWKLQRVVVSSAMDIYDRNCRPCRILWRFKARELRAGVTIFVATAFMLYRRNEDGFDRPGKWVSLNDEGRGAGCARWMAPLYGPNCTIEQHGPPEVIEALDLMHAFTIARRTWPSAQGWVCLGRQDPNDPEVCLS